MNIKKITTLNISFYVSMFFIGVFILLMYVSALSFDSLRALVSTFELKLLEYTSAGIFPSMLVAFATDIVATKQKKEHYKTFCAYSLQLLKIMCEDLPATLHACVIDVKQKENADVYDCKMTFCNWCDFLNSAQDPVQFEYLQQEIRKIKSEATKALDKMATYEEYYDEARNKAIKSLIEGCNAFCRAVDEKGRYVGNCKCHPNAFVRAVLALFPPELPENKYIKIGYTEAYNADNFCG